MNDLTKRNFLFLFGCIGTRAMLAYFAKRIGDDVVLREKYSSIIAAIALIPAIGFMYIYLTDGRKTGPEVFGQRIWWNHMRPIHAMLYFAFAILAYKKEPKAWIALAIDVVVGLSAFAYNRIYGD
jgi:hypothetical protein